MKRTIFEHLISGLSEKENAKEYLAAIGERFQVSNNAESGCLMKQLTNMKYGNNEGAGEFILKMVHVQTKLKSHDIDLNAEEEKLKKERRVIALPTLHAKPHSGKNSWKNKKNTHSASHKYPEFRKPGNKIVESMHAKFLELDVVELVIASDNIDSITLDVVTFPLPNFDNVGKSTAHGGSAPNENVVEHPVEDVVEPLIENVVDPLVIAKVVKPNEPVERIHVRRMRLRSSSYFETKLSRAGVTAESPIV
ncbi:hypothetical protein KIW84_044901 [Lathyrus oleraceus]|uniref:Uncharacterized protein n=1 Tax=Pisum sativum TaxID=3888 RepID=A0A9D4XLR1_PEA|nr:hypothetical protein KIW84_044901 [Pisum sativum]